MDEQRDSMGAVAKPGMSSSKDISTLGPSGLNAKLLGTEFERGSDSEIVHRSLYRLVAVYGDPWGADRSRARVLADEWQAALADLPAVVVDAAVTEWLRKNSKWPKPADIRTAAEDLLRRPIEAAAQRHGMHKERIKPSESMKGFAYAESPLRRHPKWGAWLNAQHPSAEHFYFSRAEFIEPHEIFGLSEFEADSIREKFGRELTSLFGRPVGLGIGPHPCREIIWTAHVPADPTDESRARVAKMVREFVGRNRTPEAKTRARKVNFEGASPEFIDLIGADHETPAPNQPQSPPTATDDFDGCSDGLS